jgi:tripartite-type tricarboxylate transporter receptor subunit TctC
VLVDNKPGGGTQIGLTALALSKADGYTIGSVSTPNLFPIYMDPSRKAVFTRKDLTAIGLQTEDTGVFSVRAESPFKTVKDLVEAAKARPDKVTVSATPLGQSQLQILHLQKLANIQLAQVQFDGGGPMLVALLGGNVDVHSGTMPDVFPQVKAGKVRVLGVTSKNRSSFLPDVPTMEEQGYPIFWGSARSYAVKTGTPVEVVERLRKAFDKAMESESMKEKIKTAGGQYRFLNGEATAQYWADNEAIATPFIKQALGK